MAKIPKHKRIKRATVLIKRTGCVRNAKNTKTFTPIYQKLKVNNHSLARALSQEKQESQLLFSRNVQLLSEVQDLAHACHSRDVVISNVLKNSKDMMQMLVTMSGYLTNTISCCQEFVSNQNNTHRASSSSSAGRRESTKRMSTKSPARGVVKPMVSGHTITKPTINLSRVNMQRLQNPNLSIIEEGSNTPDRNLDRSVRSIENRRSRTLPELRRSSIRPDDDEVTLNRRTSRFSGGRVSSSGRFSKRNSGRTSGTGIAGRLSKRNSEYLDSMKSPHVSLQDVSRYLANRQTVNIHSLSDTSINCQSSTVNPENIQVSEPSSPESINRSIVVPDTQDSSETSDSEQESNNTTKHSKKSNSSLKSHEKRSLKKNSFNPNVSMMESDYIDPKEGPSWLFDSDSQMETETTALNRETLERSQVDDEVEQEQCVSPVSSVSAERRRSSGCFRVPDLPKPYLKVNTLRVNTNNNDSFNITESEGRTNGLSSPSFRDEDDDSDRRVNLRQFITRRRGNSSRPVSANDSFGVSTNVDEDDDDETMMMIIRRQVGSQQPQQQQQQPDQAERLQFDMNELLQLTPLRPLLHIQDDNGLAQVEPDPEPTATIQLTQKIQRPAEATEAFSQLSTIRINLNGPSEVAVRSQEPTENSQTRRLSDIPTMRLSSRIELPRITDVLDTTNDQRQSLLLLTPGTSNQMEKRKRNQVKAKAVVNSDSDGEEYIPGKKKKKTKQRKKQVKIKDPSTAKVVLQKLNDSQQSLTMSETSRMERQNSDEINSARNSVLSRFEQSSDSESSTASNQSKQMSMRPRRQKAPVSLKEPKLNKKLRR